MRHGKKRGVWRQYEGCAVCGNPIVHIHHIYPGTANRRMSEEYGYTILLCQSHHTGPKGIHFDREMDLFWKRKAQEDFEARYGTRDDFIRIFGRSYLDE